MKILLVQAIITDTFDGRLFIPNSTLDNSHT
jgi:hypothetical protein